MEFEIINGKGYITEKAKIINEKGIHCRPSALIFKEASKYTKNIYTTCLENPRLEKFSTTEKYNCKSIMELISMEAGKDTILKIHVECEKAEDENARNACAGLCKLIDDLKKIDE